MKMDNEKPVERRRSKKMANLHLRVFPLGPISKPTKLISGCSSCGIITLSETRVIGGLLKVLTIYYFNVLKYFEDLTKL